MKIISKVKHASIFTGGKTDNFIREDNDFYATYPKTTKALLDVFNLVDLDKRRPKTSILEPACGTGHISKVLSHYYPNADIISTDLINRGYGQGGIDFLTYDYGRKFDVIITNPPFKIAKEFIERGLELANDYVVMLLKIQFLESKGRKAFLENSPLKYIYVFSERQAGMQSGLELNPNTGKPWSSAMMFAWFIFDVKWKGEPIVKWL